MTISNATPAGPYAVENRILGWTEEGNRLEPYDAYFIRVVRAGVPASTPADIYNSSTRPITEYLHVEGMRAWQAQMEGLVAVKEVERAENYAKHGIKSDNTASWNRKLGLSL